MTLASRAPFRTRRAKRIAIPSGTIGKYAGYSGECDGFTGGRGTCGLAGRCWALSSFSGSFDRS